MTYTTAWGKPICHVLVTRAPMKSRIWTMSTSNLIENGFDSTIFSEFGTNPGAPSPWNKFNKENEKEIAQL